MISGLGKCELCVWSLSTARIWYQSKKQCLPFFEWLMKDLVSWSWYGVALAVRLQWFFKATFLASQPTGRPLTPRSCLRTTSKTPNEQNSSHETMGCRDAINNRFDRPFSPLEDRNVLIFEIIEFKKHVLNNQWVWKSIPFIECALWIWILLPSGKLVLCSYIIQWL